MKVQFNKANGQYNLPLTKDAVKALNLRKGTRVELITINGQTVLIKK